MNFNYLEDRLIIRQDPVPVLVLDWKVMNYQLLEYYKVFDQMMNGNESKIKECFEAVWAYKLNRGLDMLPGDRRYNYTIVVVDDFKSEFFDTKGYWRHWVAHELGYRRYKAGRNEKPSEFFLIEEVGYSYLKQPNSPFYYLNQEYMEADDMAAQISREKRAGYGSDRQLFLGTSDSDWQGLISNKHEIYWANLAKFLPRLRSEEQLNWWSAVRYKYTISNPQDVYKYKMEFGDSCDGLLPGSHLRLFDLYNEDKDWKVSDENKSKIRTILEDRKPNNNWDHFNQSRDFLESRGFRLPEILPSTEKDKVKFSERVQTSLKKKKPLVDKKLRKK